jgi:Peptidase family M28
LAQDSESGDVTAALIDVGSGTEAADYAGKDVRGRLVLVSTQPEEVQALAVERNGAAGIVSYAQNQRTAWSGEDPNLLRWGHLDSFPPTPTFAFMVTLKQAQAWQTRLAVGESVQLQAHVEARRHVGHYDIVTARIRGADPRLADQEIAFSCHLDHPHPGANDNASGCATILEIARSYAKLLREGRLPRPRRSLRFIWPPEIEGTTILLNARPDLAARLAAALPLGLRTQPGRLSRAFRAAGKRAAGRARGPARRPRGSVRQRRRASTRDGRGLILLTSTPVPAAQAEFGTDKEARSMLERAVAALKENKEKALRDVHQG